MDNKDIDLNEEDLEFLEKIEMKNIKASNMILECIFSEAKNLEETKIPQYMKRMFFNEALFKALRAINFPYEMIDESSEDQANKHFNDYSNFVNDFRSQVMETCEKMHQWLPAESE